MTDRITVTVNPREADRKLKVLPELQRRRIRGVVIRDTRELAVRVRQNLSGKVLNVRTSKLLTSIKNELVENATSVYGRVFTRGVVYARIHEFGGQTRPHLIVAVHARALHFFIGNQEFFRKSVNHPGSKIPERSYLRSALAEMKAKITKDLIEAAKPNWRSI